MDITKEEEKMIENTIQNRKLSEIEAAMEGLFGKANDLLLLSQTTSDKFYNCVRSDEAYGFKSYDDDDMVSVDRFQKLCDSIKSIGVILDESNKCILHVKNKLN